MAWDRNAVEERKLWDILGKRFGNEYVHAQRPFSDYNGRFDFYVFVKDYNFAIDIFYPASYHSLVGCINHKQRTYKNINEIIYFINMNPNITDEQIDRFIKSKKLLLTNNQNVISLRRFLELVNQIPTRIEK